MKRYVILFLSVCFFSISSLGWGNEGGFAGIVKTVQPGAFIIRSGVSEDAAIGKKIAMGDVLKTGPNGTMGVIFNDDTVITMGPKSEIVIQTFLFEPAKGNLSFFAKLVEGTISFISGQITKLAPDSVRFETPAATIGPRGTHFLVQAEKK